MKNVNSPYRDITEYLLAFLRTGQSHATLQELEQVGEYLRTQGENASSERVIWKLRSLLESTSLPMEDATPQESQELKGTALSLQHHMAKVSEILGSLLNRLENQRDSSHQFDTLLGDISDKLKHAKELTDLHQLRSAVVDAGQDMSRANREFQDEMHQIECEVTDYQDEIQKLKLELRAQKRQAEKDHLTGLGNRLAFDQALNAVIEGQRDLPSPHSLFLVDLDFFKQINDQYGHAVGDDVLINFSMLLKRTLRSHDQVFRFGGDEFAILFSGLDRSEAINIAERVRKFVSDNVYRVENSRFNLSISGGLSQIGDRMDAKQWFLDADRRLYQAKKRGRNRIC